MARSARPRNRKGATFVCADFDTTFLTNFTFPHLLTPLLSLLSFRGASTELTPGILYAQICVNLR